jgi:hypothetical protein
MWPNVTGANVSTLLRTIDLVVVVFSSGITQQHTTLLDQRFELGSNFLAGSLLSLEVLLQAIHVIDARANLGKRPFIAGARSPPFSEEISGNKADRERRNRICPGDRGEATGYLCMANS